MFGDLRSPHTRDILGMSRVSGDTRYPHTRDILGVSPAYPETVSSTCDIAHVGIHTLDYPRMSQGIP